MQRLPVTFLIPVVKSLSAPLQTKLLARGDFVLEDLYSPDGKIAIDRYDSLVRESARLAGNPRLGLLQGSLADLRQLGLVAFVLMNAGTVREAYGDFQRYNALVCSGIAYELVEGHPTVFRFVNTIVGREVPSAVWDSVIASFLQLLRQLTDRAVPVLAASVPHEEAGDRAYQNAIGVVPRHGTDVTLAVDPEVLDRKIVFADPTLLAEFRQRADALLAEFPTAPTSQRLRRFLAGRWGRSQKLESAAQELGMGVRTLQQHLRDEGSSFQAVLDALRREFASAELRRGEHSIAEIAWLLGYAEQSVFQAAFRRWTGVTPLSYRRAAQEARSTKAMTGRS